MATPTYIGLANITLSGTATSVNFSSIAQTYRDLVVIGSVVNSGHNNQPGFRLNDNNAPNYSRVRMSGNGSSTSSGSGNSDYLFYLSDVAYPTSGGVALQFRADIMDYSATDKHKTVLIRSGNGSTGVEAFAGRWASTSAVTTINLLPLSGSWAAGTTFTLYGIAG